MLTVSNWEEVHTEAGGVASNRVQNAVVGLDYVPELQYLDNGFSCDQRNVQYATAHSWSQMYGIPHNSLVRAIKGRTFPQYTWSDGCNRTTTELYSEKDIVDVCVTLYHQAKLPQLDDRQMCIIWGAEYITRQWFAKMHEKIRWNRINRYAQILEQKQGVKMAKYRPDVGVPKFLRVYRLSAFMHEFWLNQSELPTLTSLTGEKWERLGTVPLWAEYLRVSDFGLHEALKNSGLSPTRQVLVANWKAQNAYHESQILEIIQAIGVASSWDIVFDTLEDWLSLPEAGNTDSTGATILEDERGQSPHLIHTTAGWAREFGTTDGAITQLIKRRQLHVNSVLGRSGDTYSEALYKITHSRYIGQKETVGNEEKKEKKEDYCWLITSESCMMGLIIA